MGLAITQDRGQRIESWLTGEAMPVWAQWGFDHARGGFFERLGIDGKPDVEAPKRTMVQARQVYVYAHAAVLGLDDGAADIARRGADFLLKYGCPDGPLNGFVHTTSRDGAVVDELRDSYDHAFVLYSLSWLYRATGESRVASILRETAAGMDRNLSHPSGLGYAESTAPGPIRRQNPHMHLFEAFLAAFAATGEAHYMERAEGLSKLFEERLFQGETSILPEYFEQDLAPAFGPRGKIVEPGHHFEWCWLLDQYGHLAGQRRSAHAELLFEVAHRNGIEAATGLVLDEIWADGSIKAETKRCWPQTEYLKAALVMGASDEEIEAIVDGIFRYFLDPAKPGTWCDRLDSMNRPVRAPIPASTFYHLFLAFSEYRRVRGGFFEGGLQ